MLICTAMDQADTTPLPASEAAAAIESDAIDSIGARIRDLRRAKKLTLARVAAATGLSIGHLSQVERGISAPSIRHLQAIAAALGVKIGWFFDGDEPVPPAERGVIVRAQRRKALTY